ncbi:hypothetical protein CBL_12244 [Carabus blaptoides fortunei]
MCKKSSLTGSTELTDRRQCRRQQPASGDNIQFSAQTVPITERKQKGNHSIYEANLTTRLRQLIPDYTSTPQISGIKWETVSKDEGQTTLNLISRSEVVDSTDRPDQFIAEKNMQASEVGSKDDRRMKNDFDKTYVTTMQK